ENLLPVIWEAPERIVVTIAREDVCPGCCLAALLQELDDGQTDRADGAAFLTVDQTQAAPVGVRLGPHQANDLAPAAAGQRNLADDLIRRRILLFRLGR